MVFEHKVSQVLQSWGAHPVSYPSLKKSLIWSLQYVLLVLFHMLQRVSSWLHKLSNMDSSSAIILTPFKYHEWKSKIGILLRSKGLCKFTLALENERNVVFEKAKWHNRLDEAYGFLCLTISPNLLFHLDGFTIPN